MITLDGSEMGLRRVIASRSFRGASRPGPSCDALTVVVAGRACKTKDHLAR